MVEVGRLSSTGRSTDKELAVRVGAAGVTVYMTRHGLEILRSKLTRILEADPKEYFEVHLGMEFSSWDADENLRSPKVGFSDGLGQVIAEKGAAELREGIASGAVPAGASLSPFEVTFMHVPPEVIDAERVAADD